MKRVLKSIGVFLLLTAVGALSAFGVLAYLFRQGEIRTPNLLGQDVVTAIDLVNRQGLQIKVDRREPSATVPQGAIVAQTPEAGSSTKKGRAVRVVVSQGPSELLAPKLAGEAYRKAEITARQAGFPAPDIARAWSDTVERDVVISQDPPPGTPLEKNGRIGLLVSLGKRPALYAMPKLTGRGSADAVRIAEKLGLQHRIVRQAASAAKTGPRTVVNQRPPAGEPVSADTTVELIVAQ